MATKLYCCKKWVNGKVQRFMSYVPCSGGATPCHEADPSSDSDTQVKDQGGLGWFGGGGGGDGQTTSVQSVYPGDEEDDHPGIIDWPDYPGQPDDPPGPDVDPDVDPDEPLPDDPVSPCEGGIRLTRDFVGGKGKGSALWNDPHNIIPSKYYRSSDWAGHQVWDPETKQYYSVEDLYAYYEKKTDVFPKGRHKVCPKGYQRRNLWCCPDASQAQTQNQNQDTLGYYQWPGNISDLLGRMGDRANYLLDYPRGLTDEEKNSIINYATTNLNRAKGSDIRATEERLARSGLAGSGLEFEETEKIDRGYREATAGLQEGLAIDDIKRRFQELTTTTAMSANLLQLLMGGETTQEGINAGRRGEGRQDMGMLLQYLQILMGGSQDNSYWQALINQMGNNQGGSSMMDWLPWAGYYAGSQF